MSETADHRAFVEQLVASHGRGADQLVPLLNALQDRFGYLPPEAMKRIAEITDIHPADLLGVSTFHDRFRHRPAGAHTLRVCHGTACHVRGSEQVERTLRRDLGFESASDTDPRQRFTLERVDCVGCCALAPVVMVDDVALGHLDSRNASELVLRTQSQRSLDPWSDRVADDGAAGSGVCVGEVRISLDSCCLMGGSSDLFHAVRDYLRVHRLAARVRRVGCTGLCRHGRAAQLVESSGRCFAYVGIDQADVEALLDHHFGGSLRAKARRLGRVALDRLVRGSGEEDAAFYDLGHRDPEHAQRERRQVRIATEHYGECDPLDLRAYRERGGFAAWDEVVRRDDPESVITALRQSALRGRGGAGFPTAVKWAAARNRAAIHKFVICNGDEGDPGAFMDRMLMESFPLRVLEGLAIAAHTVGADEAVFYIRHEYPLALRRISRAIELCREAGLIGESAMGGRVNLRLSVREGAGAFICGEETALIASIEGSRPTASPRPPYPVEHGLWGAPTLVNNVETLANVPWILRNGPEAFAALGAGESRGTKVFALAGKIRHSGLIEVPLGTTLHDIVYGIGGGISEGGTFKAVQIGGPSGGCLPAALAHTPIEYRALSDAGTIMGSGGLIVLDENDCMVELARYFLQFTENHSCGKCSVCRIGTRRMREILTRLCRGRGRQGDLDDLQFLAEQVACASLCGLGASAPNPVLSSLRYFRHEFEAHIRGRCPAGRCSELIRYQVNDRCVGCTLCAQVCPVEAIAMTPYQRHAIDDGRCVRCDTCRRMCPHQGIDIMAAESGPESPRDRERHRNQLAR